MRDENSVDLGHQIGDQSGPASERMVVHTSTCVRIVDLPDEASVRVAVHNHVDQVNAELAVGGRNVSSESALNCLVVTVLVKRGSDEEVDVHPDWAGPVVVSELVVGISVGERSDTVI